MSARSRAWLIWGVVALQVLLVAFSIFFDVLLAWPAVGADLVVNELLGKVIGLLVFAAVGAVIFSRRPEHPIGWLFCVLNLGWVVHNFAGSYVSYAVTTKHQWLPLLDLVAWLYTWPGYISTSLMILLVLLFPDGTLLSRRWRLVVWLLVGVTFLGTVALAFTPGPIDPAINLGMNNPLGIGGALGAIFAAFDGILLMSLGLLLVVAAISMILRLRRARGQERQQLKWFTSSFAFEALLAVVSFPLLFIYPSQDTMPLWAQLVSQATTLGTALIPITAGIAILRYRLYDIDIIIRRTLVYGALTTLLAALYFGGVALIQSLLKPLTGGGNDLAVVVTTLIIAALALPLRRRIQAFIDRRFYRRKYDAARTLAAFEQVARDEVDLGALANKLVGVVEETMQPEHSSLWLAMPATAKNTARRERQ